MLCFSRYDKDVHLFKSKVVDSVKLCNSHLFDPPKMDDPYAIRLVKRLHCWNSSSTATGHCRQTHPVVLLVWQTHWEQPLLSTRQFFSMESGCARGSKRANVCLQGKLYNFTFFFWIDFKDRTAICSCIAFNACYWKGFGLASLLALSCVIVEASMLRNCTFFLLMLQQRRPEDQHKGAQVSGLSWVRPGSTQPFSKDDGSPHSWTCNDARRPLDGGTRPAATLTLAYLKLYMLGVEPRNELLDCIATLLLSFKSISTNGFRVRTLVSCVTRRWQVDISATRCKLHRSQRALPFRCRKLRSCWARWYHTLFSNQN